LIFHSIVTRTHCIFSTQESCENSYDFVKAAYKLQKFVVIFCLLLLTLPDMNLVFVIFSYSLCISQIFIYTEPGFPAPCNLLTDITNFLLGQLSYMFLLRTMLLKLVVPSVSALRGSQ
jgi:hypothetical protein